MRRASGVTILKFNRDNFIYHLAFLSVCIDNGTLFINMHVQSLLDDSGIIM